jgi:nitrite reductase (NADH) small subunit
MRVFTSNLSDINRIQIGRKIYFLKHNDRQTMALFSECPHRGGPLHYGKTSDDDNSIICPWHENKLKICTLTRQSLCMVRVMDELKFLIPEEIQVTTWKEFPIMDYSTEKEHE